MSDFASATVRERPAQGFDWIDDAKRRVSDHSQSSVVIDFAGVDRINTRELGDLIRLHLRCKRTERELILENVAETVASVIYLTRLDRLIRIDAGCPR